MRAESTFQQRHGKAGLVGSAATHVSLFEFIPLRGAFDGFVDQDDAVEHDNQYEEGGGCRVEDLCEASGCLR